MTDIPTTSARAVALSLKTARRDLFFPLLQKGVRVNARVGCDIQSLLCDQFGLLPEYVTERITTIFLDGQPVDEVKRAVVHDGATLALSAAMPGLVGATFRKAGCLAVFRGSITHQGGAEEAESCSEGHITLKLFNLLLRELGPPVLARGIWIEGRDLKEILDACASDPAAGSLQVEGRATDPGQVAGSAWFGSEACYFLQVNPADSQ